MPLITEAPVTLVSADNWTITDVRIDPSTPSVSYQVVAMLGTEEVRRTLLSSSGTDLMSMEGMPELYAAIKTMLYNYAKANGAIPAEASEPQP